METEIHNLLANIWFFIISLILILYVILDGFDLGVGILTLFARNEEQRTLMMSSLGGVWDANETWLVLLGGALFGAFPIVYATVLHALYVPVMAMLFGLIFRGIALEFRSLGRNKALWNVAFGIGSMTAAASQGFIIGGLLGKMPIVNDVFAGGVWDWLTSYSVTSACAVVVIYLLFGTTYLIIKTEKEIQAVNIRYAQIASMALIVLLLIIIWWVPRLHPYVLDRWAGSPVAFSCVAALLLMAFVMIFSSLRNRREFSPFFWSVVIFILAFSLISLSYYPCIIPAVISVQQAASPSKTLIFMLTGIGMMIPVMLIYNGYQYFVFRGKVTLKNVETVSY
ncbi:cytochrome d ubiquinol oxidase subunit II [Candidatus Methylospira mobilis]|uniref:Cytochrome d ubiquinol oxidase subunit II n=1 Tax=Candidatus Methylospira mobilis TaxID=1808979 RepID=A0A5Q0BKX4_9GAMM|nr:cytochrome d ubiquinol oxidase subunit II [Candidatus Methylospira mobilis]QFY43782.1 cytochrome d ubiquinol oxidase subunit II [Candidatus Methylospira mobilis]WNV04772.1 cytochrome d ubiquinol oxidase subunit II [Candidatus Methylospira mobilis]